MTADEFKATRKALGLSQTQAAERFHVTSRQVIRWEKGDTDIPADVTFAENVTSERDIKHPDLTLVEQTGPDVTSGAPGHVTSTSRSPRQLNGWEPLDGFDPEQEGDKPPHGRDRGWALRPYPVSNTVWGASSSWDTREVKPPWKRVPGCCRVVHESIPDPIPFYGPHWSGVNGVPTKNGLVYYATTGMRMKDFNYHPAGGLVGDDQGHALVGKRPFIPNATKKNNAMPVRKRDGQ